MNDLTIKNEIQEILENLDTNLHDESYYVNKIFKLFIQSQIDLLKEFIEHPTKPGYKRHDVLKKINELELQNENKNS
jgi:hypothetical protein